MSLSTPSLAGDNTTFRPDQDPGTPEQVERGREMFGACSGCHGVDGKGVVGMAPRINSGPYLAIVSNDFIRKTIVLGRPGTNMIAWGQALPPEDVEAIVAYIRSWQTTDSIELDESPLKGNAKKGAEIFKANCQRCHGEHAHGYVESGMGIGIGNASFLDAASNGMLRAIISLGKSGTPMEGFSQPADGPYAGLTPKEIDSVIAYLRSEAE